jgi:Fe-S-cluster containining protein
MSDSPVPADDSPTPATPPPVDPAAWAEYQQRLVGIIDSLPQTTSVRELEGLIDQAVAATEAAHPPFRCRQSCFECCEGTMPVVTAAEWRELHAAIREQGEAYQHELHKRTAMAYRQQVDVLALLAARLRGEPAYIEGVDEIGMVACSFLVGGKCSVYDARPAMCRAMGYMTVVDETGIIPVMCPPAVEHIRDTFPEEHSLPRWEPFQATLNRLGRKAGIAHLPLWIMAQHDLGGYLVAAIDDPLDWAVKRMTRNDLAKEPPAPRPDADYTVGRPKLDQGLGLALGNPAVRPRPFGFGTGFYNVDNLPPSD